MATSRDYIKFGKVSILARRQEFAQSHKPLIKADKIPRTEAGYCVNDDNIAAIDFGTTSVSLAYSITSRLIRDAKDAGLGVNTLVLDREDHSNRVPNAILLKRNRRKLEVEDFGTSARKKFETKKASEYSQYVYFERIKMLLKRDQSIDRQTLVESFSGEKFYLVEVIAFILQCIKRKLIIQLNRNEDSFKTTDFYWVITVPAIWDARGKRMMREAAYMAGLLTESTNIDHLTPVSGRPLPLPIEVNPDKLSLALEPESAAFYSQKIVEGQITSDPSKAAIAHPTKYMVLDIGGGTVDVTSHVEVDGGVVVENIPIGNAWGGTQVNEAFSKLLQDIVNDPGFKKFLASRDQSQSMAILNGILYREFEDQKLLFGQGKTEEITINLPRPFAEFFDGALEAGTREMQGVEYEDDTLYIDRAVVELKLFSPVLDGIKKCALNAVKGNDYEVDTFYLVGGFGGCKYVHEKLSPAIKEVYSSKGRQCTVLVPPDPHLAVATGAVMWRKNPDIVKARRSDATYGIGICIVFDPNLHDEHYKYYDEEDGLYRCDNVFSVFLEKGELTKADEAITIGLVPFKQSNTQSLIEIYCTPDLGVQYIADKNGTEIVTKIGQLLIDIPNPDNLPKYQRKIDITMYFSDTEIQAKAKYCVNGKEVKTVCDFLSAK
ncbi:PREDICTED: heat shock 70 kDa protein 12A-like [Amphimedon queenslandica]|uniref:Uncharacterized protein n=1 Tax=Amphimedon queenslandica TaxID=400682 RepID=A0A1X7SUK6_AMPQE|nr:PREDICTED: heat shock 70 kDa protein 12A-like [Amphimedon queenslandica]|eukprot:XP_011408792.1 PREDICTED: heat shock 70 kDa protein 12A-like [Amphimedon queenslandica]